MPMRLIVAELPCCIISVPRYHQRKPIVSHYLQRFDIPIHYLHLIYTFTVLCLETRRSFGPMTKLCYRLSFYGFTDYEMCK